MEIGKEEAAIRQLDTSIRLLFRADDVVSICTLAAAASTVFADLLDNREVESWREIIYQNHPGGRREANRILRKSENFFKHANKDPEGVLDFDETTNDQLIFMTIQEYELLMPDSDRRFSLPMTIFNNWFVAVHLDEILAVRPRTEIEELADQSDRMFPNIASMPRFAQLAFGNSLLKKNLTSGNGTKP